MGIVVSVPRIVTASSLSSATYPSSSMFGLADSGESTTILNEYKTRGALVSAVSAAQTSEVPPANATDVALFHDPTSPSFTETARTDVYTVIVTSKIKVTSLITATTTVVASNCSTKPMSNAVPSVSLNEVSTTSVGIPTHSSQPAVSPFHDISLFSGLPEDGAHMAESSILTVPSLPVTSVSPFNTSGSGVGSSQSSFLTTVTLSNNVLSTSRMNASTLRSLATGFSSKNSSSLLPMRKSTPIATERPTGLLRVASASQSGRRNHATGGVDDAQCESDHILHSNGPPTELRFLASVTGSPRYLTIPPPANRKPTAASTKIKNLTITTTIYTTELKKHTSTTTITAFRTSCSTTTTALTSSAASSPACTSATPNPNPSANKTCAEDGLLEMSSTLQPPVTLEGCALACLADTSCLSFTFIPDQRTCSTSLYPLVDSAFAGLQDSPIYNYDRDCYSCSA